jgi:hypothetical protein
VDPFVLNEEAARAWLTELVVAYEVDASFGGDSVLVSPDSLLIGMAWSPRQPGEEDAAFLLVKGAQAVRVIDKPKEMTITFEFVDDGNEGIYRWLLDISAPSPLKLATLTEAMAVLGEPEPEGTGVEIAIAVLQEAVKQANHLIHQLSDYVEANTQQGGN